MNVAIRLQHLYYDLLSSQPRASFKEFFVVFRAPSGAEKFVDFYQNERKYSDVSPPKWSIDISMATTVSVISDNRVCVCIEVEESGACLFEAPSVEAAEEWLSCFNAVLFTKGRHGGE